MTSRISEIEEYVAYLESETEQGDYQYDAELLKDVKVKLAVHRDWERRRADGTPDIGCDKKPWQLPFSTRTSAEQAPARPSLANVNTGLSSQVRDDHPPFSVYREDDQTAFIAALKKDASGDPDEIDTSRNLLWTESRAYTWALQEPNLVPSWMHPILGIPKKGVSLADPTTWHQQSTAVYSVNNEQGYPHRERVPGYLLARERRINSLLKPELNHPEMDELEDLLHFLEPPQLYNLHAENIALDLDNALGLINEVEQTHKKRVSDAFAAEQRRWLSTFAGVHFIAKQTSGEETMSEQSGVFYVDPGVLNTERQATLKNANDLLKQAFASAPNLGNLKKEDLTALEGFLQISQPASITNLTRQRAAIIRQAGVRFKQELANTDFQRHEQIYRVEQTMRNEWLMSLANNKPEFRYLRPGEAPAVPLNPNSPQLLYIPWEMAKVPTLDTPILHESAIPSSGKSYMPCYTTRYVSQID